MNLKSTPIKLHDEEEQELRMAQEVYETTQTPGFKVIKEKLETLGFHAWVDPRGTTKEEWAWQELNAYHAANNAKELLEWISQMVSRGEYLDKKKKGELSVNPMKI